MLIKPLYLLADSQLLFWKEAEHGIVDRLRADMDSSSPKAAYLGASNGDNPEFYALFTAAMETAGLTDCRMIPSQLSKEDQDFLNASDLILLAGGDVEQGWNIFEKNGVKEIIGRKRYEGAVLIGVSAGAAQLGIGALIGSSTMKTLETFRFAPFYVGAHEEQE